MVTHFIKRNIRAMPRGEEDGPMGAIAWPLLRSGSAASRSIPFNRRQAMNATDLEVRGRLALICFLH